MANKYIYVRSPLKAAQLLDRGFRSIKAPVARDQSLFIFEYSEALQSYLAEHFALSDYAVSDRALICF